MEHLVSDQDDENGLVRALRSPAKSIARPPRISSTPPAKLNERNESLEVNLSHFGRHQGDERLRDEGISVTFGTLNSKPIEP